MDVHTEQSATDLTVKEPGDNRAFKGNLCNLFTIRRKKTQIYSWSFERCTKTHGYVRREISILRQR